MENMMFSRRVGVDCASQEWPGVVCKEEVHFKSRMRRKKEDCLDDASQKVKAARGENALPPTTHCRFQYEEEVRKNPLNYDNWFDYIKLEEDSGDVDRVREVYERAVANLPPANEKRYWQRSEIHELAALPWREHIKVVASSEDMKQ
eukprot:1157757-Pelagomonas_calceolata.AAC.15